MYAHHGGPWQARFIHALLWIARSRSSSPFGFDRSTFLSFTILCNRVDFYIFLSWMPPVRSTGLQVDSVGAS